MAIFNNNFVANNKKEFEKFAEDFVNSIILVIENKDINASGNLQRSLDYRFVENIGELDLNVIGEKYYTYVDEGRKANRFPPVNAIRKWATLKGISPDAAWPIAQKIYQFGIPPRNITLEAFRKMVTEDLPRLEERLGVSLGMNLVDIINNIDDINE